MRWLVALLIGVLVLSDIMSWPMSLAPGLSVKNVALYLLLFTLMFRTALRGIGTSETPALHALFIVWVFYAVATWIVAALIIRYPLYGLVDNGITLKADLIDNVMYFLLAFHGLRDSEDVQFVFKSLAAALGLASLATITDVVGITHLGITIGTSGAEEGRVFGVFGHANDTAALMNGLLPMCLAVALASRGGMRNVWFAAVIASVIVLLLTVSRGGYVAAVVGSAIGVFLCRRLLPVQKLFGWAVGAGVAVVTLVALAGLAVPSIGTIITQRLFNGGFSVNEMSSGRTELWATIFNRMLDNPITLLTGYGWDVYYVMPFRFVTHNFYLHLWFNLGLVGLGAFLIVLAIVLRTSLRAAASTQGELRPYLISCAFGIPMLGVAVFFCNLSGHWAFFWIYLGTALRAAYITLEAPAAIASAPARAPLHELRPVRTTFAGSTR